MKQFVKTLTAMLLIALCLTSDTALNASQFKSSKFKVQESARHLSMNSVVFVNTGQRPPSWVYRKSTPPPLTPPCG